MLHQRILARVVGVSQLALGAAFLLIPDLFLALFGFSPASPDQKYLLGQLAARFVAYGIGMFVVARNLGANRVWWDLMALIQIIDLGVGAYGVTVTGVPFNVAAFPMFNAAVFATLLVLWRPAREEQGCTKG